MDFSAASSVRNDIELGALIHWPIHYAFSDVAVPLLALRAGQGFR